MLSKLLPYSNIHVLADAKKTNKMQRTFSWRVAVDNGIARFVDANAG